MIATCGTDYRTFTDEICRVVKAKKRRGQQEQRRSGQIREWSSDASRTQGSLRGKRSYKSLGRMNDVAREELGEKDEEGKGQVED